MLQHIWKCFLLHRTTTWPTESVWNRIWDFTSVSAFEKKLPLPPLNHPLLTLSYWPSVTVTVTTKLMQLSAWHARQYRTVSNRVTHSKETYIMFKYDNVLWWRGNKHIWSSQWMKWKKVTKLTHTYVAWKCLYSLINVAFSCPCAHHGGIWERGGTTPRIINPAPLHTVPSGNILATIWSVNPPFSPHFISYQNKVHFHSLYILVSLFLWVTGF